MVQNGSKEGRDLFITIEAAQIHQNEELIPLQLPCQLHIVQNALQVISIIVQNLNTGGANYSIDTDFITGNCAWQLKRKLLNKLLHFPQQLHCANIISFVQRFRLQPGLQLGNQRFFADFKGEKTVKYLRKFRKGDRHIIL